MKNLIDYSEYSTENPFMVINEKYGIPEILKSLLEIVNSKIEDSLSNNESSILIDFVSPEINLKNLQIELVNRNKDTIYGICQFGTYTPILNKKNGQLNNPSIKLEFNFNNFDRVDLKKTILHELLHIYEVYNRIVGKTKSDINWKLNKIIFKLRDKYNDDKFISDFLYVIYLSLDQEIGARVAETYTILMDKNTTNLEILKNVLENNTSWKYMKVLGNFNPSNYNINYTLLDSCFKEINTQMNGEIEKLNISLFKDLDSKTLLKKWINNFKIKSKKFERKLLRIIPEVINDINLINSKIIDIDESKELSDQFVIKYNIELDRNNKIYKILR
jgi:hypothetical protein